MGCVEERGQGPSPPTTQILTEQLWNERGAAAPAPSVLFLARAAPGAVGLLAQIPNRDRSRLPVFDPDELSMQAALVESPLVALNGPSAPPPPGRSRGRAPWRRTAGRSPDIESSGDRGCPWSLCALRGSSGNEGWYPSRPFPRRWRPKRRRQQRIFGRGDLQEAGMDDGSHVLGD